MNITYENLAEEMPEENKPLLDRAEVDERSLTGYQLSWRKHGVLVLSKFMPDHLVEAYRQERQKLADPKGWPFPCPYVDKLAMRDMALYAPLMQLLDKLIGSEMGLHLCLTGWVSTERDWHSDDYLNPEFVQSHYLACWFALEDIDPRSGPFEFVRGSHKWPTIRRHKLFNYLNTEEQNSPDWPTNTQGWVAKACAEEIEKRQAKTEVALLSRGDVLIWHGRLLHRGSKPMIPNMPRRALISHYSAIDKRTDMAKWEWHRNKRRFFIP